MTLHFAINRAELTLCHFCFLDSLTDLKISNKSEVIIWFLSLYQLRCSAVLGCFIFLNIFNKILLITFSLYFSTILVVVDCPVSWCPSFRQFHSPLHLTSVVNRRMAWHKGSWWPLFVKEWYAPRSSQHMFDPYSFCLVVLGLLFHLLWGTDDIDYWIFGFLAALLLELLLEIVGNSKFVLERIRNNSGTSGEYIGKSWQGGNI